VPSVPTLNILKSFTQVVLSGYTPRRWEKAPW
jgi:hypothetical protein